MSQYLIKYRSGGSNIRSGMIEADNKREAMMKFNEKFKSYNFEIKEVQDLSLPNEEKMEVEMKPEKVELSKVENQQLEYKKMSDMLDGTNEILYEQLKHFKEIDTKDEKKLGLEKAKNDSLSGIAKTLVQSISIKAMIDNKKGMM